MPQGSAYAYSSRRSEEELNIGRQAERAKVKVAKTGTYWAQRFGLIILAIAVVASAFNVLSLSSTPKVMLLDPNSKIKLTVQATQDYQAVASKALSSSMWNGNKVTVDTQAISNKLLADFPDLDSVSVAIPLAARRPVIYVEPSQPALILSEPHYAYELNTNGRAIAEAASAQIFNNINLPIVTDQSGLDVKVHSQALSSTYISFVQQVSGQLANKGFTISSIIFPPEAYELDVRITGEPYYIKFNLENNDPRQQAGTFLATINYLKSKSITPAQYIDVRLDGRAYYK
jgi:hypothetical protein